jgi:hypothetical protein
MSTARLVRCVTLTACVLLAHAQPKDVILNVTAVDAKGHPVTDLTSADFQIFDQGKVQHFASFQASAAQPPTTLIFLDLLNSIPGHREYESTLIVHALEPLETGDSVYLYLLTNHASIPYMLFQRRRERCRSPGPALPARGKFIRCSIGRCGMYMGSGPWMTRTKGSARL